MEGGRYNYWRNCICMSPLYSSKCLTVNCLHKLYWKGNKDKVYYIGHHITGGHYILHVVMFHEAHLLRISQR